MPFIFDEHTGRNLQYMIENNTYPNTLYLYYDNIEELCTYKSGKFSAIIRPYNQFNPNNKIPLSCGIPVANKKGGFPKITKQVLVYLTLVFDDIQALIDKYQYTNIIVPMKDNKLFTQVYYIGEDVSDFIIKKINSLKLNLE